MRQVKKTEPAVIYRRVAIFVLLLIVIVLAKSVVDLYYKNQVARENARITVEKLDELKQREKILQYNTDKLKTDEGVEEEIRKNFPVAKEGEKVINLVDDEKATTAPATTTEGFWQKLFN